MARRHKTGQSIPSSGVYRAYHTRHRLPHEVTLLKGQSFPRCAACGDAVEFEPLHTVSEAAFDLRGRITLHALPEIGEGTTE